MRNLLLLRLAVLSAALASCGTTLPDQVATKENGPTLKAQALTRTITVAALSGSLPECADLSLTIIGGTSQDPLTAYYVVATKSTTNGYSWFPQFKDVTFTIDSDRTWTVNAACRDVRPGMTSNHSASAFTLWDNRSSLTTFTSVPGNFLVTHNKDKGWWPSYGITKEIRTGQGSFYPDTNPTYGETHRPRAGSN